MDELLKDLARLADVTEAKKKCDEAYNEQLRKMVDHCEYKIGDKVFCNMGRHKGKKMVITNIQFEPEGIAHGGRFRAFGYILTVDGRRSIYFGDWVSNFEGRSE